MNIKILLLPVLVLFAECKTKEHSDNRDLNNKENSVGEIRDGSIYNEKDSFRSEACFDTTRSLPGHRYFKNDKLNYEEFWESGYDSFVSYYENGVVKSIAIAEAIWVSHQETRRKEFSQTGELIREVYCEHYETKRKPHHFGPPQIMFIKEYENSKLSMEGQIYSVCSECDEDTVGDWKFYESGKLKNTKRYHSIPDSIAVQMK